MHRLLVAPLLLMISLPIFASNHVNHRQPIIDEKRLLYLQRGCFFRWLEGKYSESISYCTKAINYATTAYEEKAIISFEYRGLAKQALGDPNGACDDLKKVIELGGIPMPSYQERFARLYRKKRLDLEHSEAFKAVEIQLTNENYMNQNLELKLIKKVCKIQS